MISVRIRMAATLAAALLLAACSLLQSEPTAARPLDLNAAPLRAVGKLPGITPSMARRMIDGRPYGDPHQLVERGILTERELERIADLLVVREQSR